MSSFLIQATTTTTTTTLLLLSLFLISPSTATADIVLDLKGDPLVASSYYYAGSISQTGGGGLTMFNNGSKGCPSFIVAKSTKGGLDFGIPIKFDPQTPENHNVHLSTNVSIAFKYISPQPLCRRFYSTVWAVSNDGKTVVLDGEEGREDSLFKLEEYGGGYKILFGEKTVLYDEKYSGEALLSLVSGKPLLVLFVKAKGSKLDVV